MPYTTGIIFTNEQLEMLVSACKSYLDKLFEMGDAASPHEVSSISRVLGIFEGTLRMKEWTDGKGEEMPLN